MFAIAFLKGNWPREQTLRVVCGQVTIIRWKAHTRRLARSVDDKKTAGGGEGTP